MEKEPTVIVTKEPFRWLCHLKAQRDNNLRGDAEERCPSG